MKWNILSILFLLSLLASYVKAETIIARTVSEIRPDIALKLVEIMDSVDNHETVWTKTWLRKNIYCNANDSVWNLVESYSFYQRPFNDFILVVINSLPEKASWDPYRKINKKGDFFTILLLSEQSLSNRIYNDYLWLNNRSVRQYGFMKILGYDVLLVDLKNGQSYFKLSEYSKSEKELIFRNYPPASPDGAYVGHIEYFYKFIYQSIGHKLVPIYELWPFPV